VIEEENIYSEPIFDDDSVDDENMPAVNCAMPNTNHNHASRIAVLEKIPSNYVLFAPKAGLACGEGVITCTLVPREMVDTMMTVLNKGEEGHSCQDLGMKPGDELHRKSNIEYLRNYEPSIKDETKESCQEDEHEDNDGYSDHEEEEGESCQDYGMKPGDELCRNSNIEYMRNNKTKDSCEEDEHEDNDGYSDHEEEEELDKIEYENALLNLISNTSLEIKDCHNDDHRLFHPHSTTRRQKPKRSPSKVSSFLGNIFRGHPTSKQQRYSKRKTSRHVEASDTQEENERPELMERQLKHNIRIIGVYEK